ncbi:hypothetical protein AB833_20195 [Chromatiales bacterium (ex Bugula neritina AB1)]|nr:hypothetical protein AB833_20195 [Chromatiales bacterium (ex Bugula neritina AB1)]
MISKLADSANTVVAQVLRSDSIIITVSVKQATCNRCNGCVSSDTVGSSSSATELRIPVQRISNQAFKAGEEVDLQLYPGALITVTSLVYLVPLLLMLLFASMANQFISAADSIIVIFAAVGLLAGFLFIRTGLSCSGNRHLTTLIAAPATDKKAAPGQRAVISAKKA